MAKHKYSLRQRVLRAMPYKQKITLSVIRSVLNTYSAKRITTALCYLIRNGDVELVFRGRNGSSIYRRVAKVAVDEPVATKFVRRASHPVQTADVKAVREASQAPGPVRHVDPSSIGSVNLSQAIDKLLNAVSDIEKLVGAAVERTDTSDKDAEIAQLKRRLAAVQSAARGA